MMLLRLSFLLTTALFSAAKENEDRNNLVLDPSVTTTFLFRGTSLRVWSKRENQDSSNQKDWRFFYEPVIFPVLSKDNQTNVTVHTDTSLEIQGVTKLLLSTNSSQLLDLVYKAVKMALGNDAEILKLNIEPLPILELNLTGPWLFEESSNFHSCLKKTYKNPGQTVELAITKELLENGYISYSMDVGLDTLVREKTVTCKNGNVEIFGLLRGKVNLREYLLMQQSRMQSKQNSEMKEQLERVVSIKKEELESTQNEILVLLNTLKDKEDELNNGLKNCSFGLTRKCFHGICSCYLFFLEEVTWENALKSCKSLGLELVSIHSKEEQDFIGTLLNGSNSYFVWIGLNDRSEEGSFQWTDGTELNFTFWFDNQPDNIGGSGRFQGDCVLLSHSGYRFKWNDYSCSSKNAYTCKQRL